MSLKFTGVRRKTEFSPNHVENDLLIINRTAENLESMGAKVTMVDEAALSPDTVTENLIFSMAQGPIGTKALHAIVTARECFVINSPSSVCQCYRTNMVSRLPAAGVPFPRSIVIETGDRTTAAAASRMGGKLWVKRGDVHAVHREDVVQVADSSEAMMIVREFAKRGIEQAILQEHLDGDTVKFYAVRESSFFHWYYLNGVYHTPFDQTALIDLAAQSAEALGLWIFGGDAIIRKDGSIAIIDINDWPSFAPVRDEASRQIAQLIYRKAQEYCYARDCKQEVSSQD
ncbi:MAG TPA: hypothetical protein VMS71_07215 [Candidatus Acidoferrum sp.]|nr:hypothetical protein [Candidatus Acidoferrum sp.]